VRLPLAWRLAARELRGGVRGFRVFLACLALGVAAIAASGSTGEAFRAGLAAQAREILGGDVAVSIAQRRFTPAERATLAGFGAVEYAVASQAMAQAPSGERRLVELRGVSDDYPLVGKVDLAGGLTLAQAFTPDGDAQGAAVEKPLLDRLGLKLGDRFLVGNAPIVARALLIAEPDRLSRGFALGPRVLTRIGVLDAGGFLAPGLSFGETARIALPAGRSPGEVKAILKRLLNAGPDGGGLRVRDRTDATPGLRRLIDQLEYFLGFIGLASLIAGGLGISTAVSAYIAQRTSTIATLKALGADGALTRDLYLIQIALLAMLGIAIGLVSGAGAPLLLGQWLKASLPIPALFAVYPWPLAKAAAFGLLAAAAFSLTPLAGARATPPSALLRNDVARRPTLGVESLGAAIAAAALAALAVATAPTPLAAAVMIAGVAAAFAVLWGLGAAAAALSGAVRGATAGTLRMALANLAGPRSAARTAAPAIGLGVALLSAVVLIQSSLLAEVTDVAPRTAPALVFTEIPAAAGPAFDAAVARAFGDPLTADNYLRAPFATGRITRVRGAAVVRSRIDPADRWAYDNDITLSAIGPQPRDAGIIAGRWWPAGYAGAPLVALSSDAARGERVKVGDTITVSLLGRDIDARVAVIRKVDLGGFGANFPIVLDPAAIADADLANVAIAKASRAQERDVTRDLGRSFPQVNVISVREQLEAAGDLLSRLALAVRGAAAVAGLAGLLVLAGAIAAGARARAKEAATLKVLGASRRQILALYILEYGAVGVIAGLAGVALGYAAAWPVVALVFETRWSVDWSGVAALIAGAAGLAGAGGLLAAGGALAQRPAPILRAD
jgi:putative ABC transport system permease protein